MHGNKDNSINPKDSIVDEATEFSLLSVHINTIGISVGLMVLMLCLVCIFCYLKLAHLRGCWLKLKFCKTKKIFINSDGTLSYVQKSQRNSIISGQLAMSQQPRDEVTNDMRMEEIRQELKHIKLNQEQELSSISDMQGNIKNNQKTCPKIL